MCEPRVPQSERRGVPAFGNPNSLDRQIDTNSERNYIYDILQIRKLHKWMPGQFLQENFCTFHYVKLNGIGQHPHFGTQSWIQNTARSTFVKIILHNITHNFFNSDIYITLDVEKSATDSYASGPEMFAA
jgi:hypothetical protein